MNQEVVRLHERVAITFHRNLPPLATYLTRDYEENRNEAPAAGMWTVAAHAAAVCVPVLLLAVLFTVGLVRRFQ